MSAEMTDEELIKIMDRTEGFESTKRITTIFLRNPTISLGTHWIAPYHLRQRIREEGEDPSYQTMVWASTIPGIIFDLAVMKALWKGIDSEQIISEDTFIIHRDGESFSVTKNFFDQFIDVYQSINNDPISLQ